jgi:hypothetical protein
MKTAHTFSGFQSTTFESATDLPEVLKCTSGSLPGPTSRESLRIAGGSKRKSTASIFPKSQPTHLEAVRADRLLHTAADSQTADDQLDHRFYVTADHYESAVPVTPVESNYKQNHPYDAQYDKDGKPV